MKIQSALLSRIIKLLMDHFLVALGIGILASLVFSDWSLIFVALLTGWMVDVDHIYDFAFYLNKYGISKVNPEFLIRGEYFKLNNRVFVLLHSWEFLFIWLVVFIALHKYSLAITGSIAWAFHILKDQMAYKVTPMGYSLIYRASKGFSRNGFCPS